jgi:hypothetical protein
MYRKPAAISQWCCGIKPLHCRGQLMAMPSTDVRVSWKSIDADCLNQHFAPVPRTQMHVDSQVLHRGWGRSFSTSAGVVLRSRRPTAVYWYLVQCVSGQRGMSRWIPIEQNNLSPCERAKEDTYGQYGGRTQDLGVISTTL